jgi:hypothetical protein
VLQRPHMGGSMGNFFRHATLYAVALLNSFQGTARGVDFGKIKSQLEGKGVQGWVHGAVDPIDQFVFTYRTPGHFFDHAEFPLIPKSEEVRKALAKLQRHDKVEIRGSYFENGAPIRHILVRELEVKKKYEPEVQAGPYQHETNLPEALIGETEVIGNVHAVAAEGKVLVVEYKDAIIPVPIPEALIELTKGMYRNDKVRIRFKFQDNPDRPTHLTPDMSVPEPIKVLEHIVDINGKTGTLEGNLILFPKSPEIIFNVFAIEQINADGFTRQFTLVNFEDEAAFTAIRTKLQKLWDDHPGAIVNGRNKLVNRKVRIRVTGTFNQVDPGQANPQVLLAGPEAITVLN